MRVFISHAKKDGALASELGSFLADAGFKVWSSADHVWPGDNWARKIGKALDDAEFMVVLFTSRALKSDWLRQDIQFALGNKKFEGHFFSVFLAPSTAASAGVPPILKKLPHIEVESHKDFGQVVEQIRTLTMASAST